MATITTAPIRTIDDAEISDEEIVGSIGRLAVTKARMIGRIGEREEWGVFVRPAGQDAVMLFGYVNNDAASFQASVHHLACIVFNSLHVAFEHSSHLCAEQACMDEFLSADAATLGAA